MSGPRLSDVITMETSRRALASVQLIGPTEHRTSMRAIQRAERVLRNRERCDPGRRGYGFSAGEPWCAFAFEDAAGALDAARLTSLADFLD